MFNNMFDELKEVKYRFHESYKAKCFKKNKTFGESSKSRGVLRTQANT